MRVKGTLGKGLRLSGPKQEKKADQKLVVEYTTVATITRKTKEYGRVQQKIQIQAEFALATKKCVKMNQTSCQNYPIYESL